MIAAILMIPNVGSIAAGLRAHSMAHRVDRPLKIRSRGRLGKPLF
jgi:hypothetical protein